MNLIATVPHLLGETTLGTFQRNQPVDTLNFHGARCVHCFDTHWIKTQQRMHHLRPPNANHPPVRLVGKTPHQREKILWKSTRNKYEIVMGTWKNIISFLKLLAISSNVEAWRRCGPTETPFKAKSLGDVSIMYHLNQFKKMCVKFHSCQVLQDRKHLSDLGGVHPKLVSSTLVRRRQQ